MSLHFFSQLFFSTFRIPLPSFEICHMENIRVFRSRTLPPDLIPDWITFFKEKPLPPQTRGKNSRIKK